MRKDKPLSMAMQGLFVTIGDMTRESTPGMRFRAFRTHIRLTGQQLAEQLGVTKTAISYWETGRSSLSAVACHLAEQLHQVSAAWLLEGKGSMWLPIPPPALHEAPDIVLRPLLPEGDAFNADGSV